MAVFKCKMCGGALEVAENATTAICDYCGSQQTLPKLNDDKITRLYDRAGHFRRNNEFDKASAIYEEILNEDNTDAEAYWSLVLCGYGIEYVEDPATQKRVPTVNRAQFTSIFDDDNYKSALRYADVGQKGIYETEAKTINEIQKGILEISQKEEPFDIFICYKETDENGKRTRDSVTAQDLYYQLTEEGFKVFFARITLEGKLGVAYEPYIFAALNSAKIMVVLGTKPEYFNSVWVKNEWSRYLSLVKQSGGKKMLIPAYKDMDPYDLPEEFSHLQAQDMSKLGFMQDLIRGIKKIIPKGYSGTQTEKTVSSSNANSTSTSQKSIDKGDVDTILRRVAIFLEGKDWGNANIYCEKALDIDPENSQAYMYKLMAKVQATEESHIVKSMVPLDGMLEYKNAVRFSDEDTAARLLSYNNKIVEKLSQIERQKREYEQQERKKAQQEARRQAELKNMNTAKSNTTNVLTSLVKEKERIENAIQQTQKNAQTIKNPKALKGLCTFNILLAVAALFTLIISASTANASGLVIFALLAISYIIVSVVVLKKGGMHVALIFLNIFYGIPSIVFACIVSGKCKKQISAQYNVELQSLTAQLKNVNARIEEVRHSLLEINSKISSK